jgi:AraC-like DNA-binding protein
MGIKLFSRDLKVLLSIKQLMDRDFRKKFSMEDLEKISNINSSKLRFGFKQEFGISIFQ